MGFRLVSPPFLRSQVLSSSTVHAGTYVTIITKATFRLVPGRLELIEDHPDEILTSDEHVDGDPQKSVRRPADTAPFKPSPEVMLVGSAFAPQGRSVARLLARLAVGSVDKSIDVEQDRHFDLDNRLVDGPLFRAMPLTYERAGAAADSWNPVGIAADGKRDQRGRLALPNLQPPGFTLRGPGNTVPAIGYGPIAATWPSRVEHSATHGGSPEGRQHLSAPSDQWLDEILPDESIILENLHPQHPSFSTRLPGLRLRVRTSQPSEFTMTPDTLFIDTDRLIATLCWRKRLGVGLAQNIDFAIRVEGLPVSARQDTMVIDLDQETETHPKVELPAAVHHSGDERLSSPTLEFDMSSDSKGDLPFTSAHAWGGPLTSTGGTISPPNLTLPKVDAPPTKPATTAAPHPPAPPNSVPSLGTIAQPSVPAVVAAPMVNAAMLSDPIVAKPLQSVAPVSPSPRVPVPALVQNSREMALGVRLSGPANSEVSVPIISGGIEMKAAASRGLLAVSNAAAGPRVEARAPGKDATDSPSARPAEIDILHCDTSQAPSLRLEASLAMQLPDRTENPPEPAKVERGKPPPPPPPPVDRPKKEQRDGLDDFVWLLARGNATSFEDLQAILRRGPSSGMLHPWVLVECFLHVALDELALLRATVDAALPLSKTDKRLKETLDAVDETLKMPLQGAGDFVTGLVRQIREAWARANRSFPPHFISANVERSLVEKRTFQTRRVLGSDHVRASLSTVAAASHEVAAPSGPLVVAYLPQVVVEALPMHRSLPVRIIGELRPQQDPLESSALCLKPFALARRLSVTT